MQNKLSVLCVFIVLSLLFPLRCGFSQAEQKPIVEEVDVEWWVIPVFAVDAAGKPVPDLKVSDIRLLVNKKKTANFYLSRKSFTRMEAKDIPTPKDKTRTGQTPPAVQRARNVFLLFDTALSTKESTIRAQAVARKIVAHADDQTRFFVMTIEPFGGLTYACGPLQDKTQITRIIDNQVRGKKNTRLPTYTEITSDIDGRQKKYDQDDKKVLTRFSSKYHIRKSISFVNSFKALYYALNSIPDNKFVYLFSEGVPNSYQEVDRGNFAMYAYFYKQMSSWLGRSGAVLFLINPLTPDLHEDPAKSGDRSLASIAKESGGKYLKGSQENIIKRISNIHGAYYEIFFPAKTTAGKDALNISISSPRKGISLHTLRTTERKRPYPKMNTLEQEVLVLNLVSGNPMYKAGLTYNIAEVKDISRKKDRVTIKMMLPGSLAGQPVDIFKVWMNENENAKGQGARVEKKTLRLKPGPYAITFKQVKKDENVYFALVGNQGKTAWIHGKKTAEQEPQKQAIAFQLPEDKETWATVDRMVKAKQDMTTGDRSQLQRLLDGAAGYCQRLKKAAFHYICKEKVVETQRPLSHSKTLLKDVTSAGEPNRQFLRAQVGRERIDTQGPQIKKHQFNYRLIKQGKNIKEERDADSAKDSTKNFRFLSSRAVFGPVTMLDAQRQDKYHFRLIATKKLKGRPVAVIEALPKKNEDAQFVYGKIWLDTENFSILKINANPNSIVGYDRLQQIAAKLNSRLSLGLETEFFKLRDGIRFPTTIRFLESYKGGPVLTSRRGSKGWKRTQTITTYSGYSFFKVEMDVTYD
jgi:hypothetical protein